MHTLNVWIAQIQIQAMHMHPYLQACLCQLVNFQELLKQVDGFGSKYKEMCACVMRLNV